MDYVNLGSTGLKVSRICLGCMTYGTSKMPHLEQAVEALAIQLTDDEIARLEEPYQPHCVLEY